jgi:hypothetical protein
MTDMGVVLPRIHALDRALRNIVPKCAMCERPDGGVVNRGLTPQQAGVVDRKRCPEPECPMRAASAESMLIYIGEPAS